MKWNFELIIKRLAAYVAAPTTGSVGVLAAQVAALILGFFTGAEKVLEMANGFGSEMKKAEDEFEKAPEGAKQHLSFSEMFSLAQAQFGITMTVEQAVEVAKELAEKIVPENLSDMAVVALFDRPDPKLGFPPIFDEFYDWLCNQFPGDIVAAAERNWEIEEEEKRRHMEEEREQGNYWACPQNHSEETAFFAVMGYLPENTRSMYQMTAAQDALYAKKLAAYEAGVDPRDEENLDEVKRAEERKYQRHLDCAAIIDNAGKAAEMDLAVIGDDDPMDNCYSEGKYAELSGSK